MARIGFARVSSVGQNLDAQVKRLEAAGCDRVISGKHSGKKETNAQALGELLATVEAGDVVVVTKIDRLGRSLSQVLQTLDTLEDRGISLVALDQNLDTTRRQDPLSRAMVHLLGMFAELERNLIVERTQEGKLATGNYGGRPHKLSDKQREEIRRRHAKGESKNALSAVYGVSRATVRRVVEAKS